MSPHPDTGLTYIPKAGWDGAMQTALKPDQLAAGALRAHQNSGFARQGFPCIASHPGCSLLTTKPRKDLTRILGRKLCTKQKRLLSGLTFCFFSMFHVSSVRKKTEKVKNNSLSSCVTSLMKPFLKHLICFRNKELVLIWVWMMGRKSRVWTGINYRLFCPGRELLFIASPCCVLVMSYPPTPSKQSSVLYLMSRKKKSDSLWMKIRHFVFSFELEHLFMCY